MTFSFKKIIWKCRLRNGGHFVSASMCFNKWCAYMALPTANPPTLSHGPWCWCNDMEAPCMQGIRRWPVDSPHIGPIKWCFDFLAVLCLKCCWTNSQVATCDVQAAMTVAVITSLVYDPSQCIHPPHLLKLWDHDIFSSTPCSRKVSTFIFDIKLMNKIQKRVSMIYVISIYLLTYG